MTIFETAVRTSEIPTISAVTPTVTTKKHSMLPLLTILFIISYSLMTMLIVEQGQTIESQRALIRELFRDSTELSGVKMKAAIDAHAAQAQAQAHAPSTQTPSTQAPSVQTPSTQVPSTHAPSMQAQDSQAPSSQVIPQHRAQSQAKAKPQFQLPSKPASDLADSRRSLITI